MAQNSTPVLRDWHHASKIFRTDSYAQAPKFKFLFHVYFNINESVYPVGLGQGTNFGVFVKDIKLPSFSFTTSTMNQYNRKRIVQTKIKYDPVNISFHDDTTNQITQMWNAYYVYYYKDGSKPAVTFAGARGEPPPSANRIYNTRNTYINQISGDNDWGYIGEGIAQERYETLKVPFFKEITTFSLYSNHWTAYTLINPVITQFAHDTHNYNEGNGIMQNTMTLDYETVVYNYGAIEEGQDPSNIVPGFGMPQDYDLTPSPNYIPTNPEL